MENELDALQKLVNTAVEFGVNYSFQILGAFLVLIVGFIAASIIGGFLLKMFAKKNFDITLSRFITSIIKGLIIAFAVIIALGKFGITIAPFVAALGAVAFGASLAIQGPLSNFGAGVTIILTRPFVVGNTITVAETSGVVEEVTLGATKLINEDGVTITIPNKHIVGEILYNSQENKIYEGSIGISYDSDPEKAISTIENVLAKFSSDVRQDPKPQVGIEAFADSSVNIAYRIWVPTQKFFNVTFAINQEIFKAFGEQNINIPFPQRDIHIVSQPEKAGI